MSRLLNTLLDIRQNQIPAAGYQRPEFVYGWLPGNPYIGNGQATADYAPVYPASEELTPKKVRELVAAALPRAVADPLPARGRIDRRDERELRVVLDGQGHLLAHPPGRAEDAHPDHAYGPP